MDTAHARRVLDAALSGWSEDPPDWSDVLAHESVRHMRAALVHAIEQHGWEDPMEAAVELLDSSSPRAEEQLLTKAIATWAESTAAPEVSLPPSAPGALRSWAREYGVEAMLRRPADEVLARVPRDVSSRDRQTVGDLYRVASAASRGRASGMDENEAADLCDRILDLLYSEALGLAHEDTVHERLSELEDRPWAGHVGRLFDGLTALARKLEPAVESRWPPIEMVFRDDPPRFLPRDELATRGERGVWLEDGLEPALRTRGDERASEQLALIDGARTALGDAAVAERVEEVLSTPAWQRMLEAVDGAVAAEAAPESGGVRVEWRVGPAGDGRVELWPYLQKRSKRGGWTKGRRAAPGDLDVPARDHLERVATELYEHSMDRGGPGPDELADLLELLRDARLVHAESGAPVRVSRVHPRLVFATRRGALVPRLRIGSLVLTPTEARHRIGRGEVILALDDGDAPVVWIARLDDGQRRLLGALASQPTHVPDDPEARRALLARAPALARHFDVGLPEDLRGRAVAGDQRLVVRLDLGQSTLTVWLGVRPFPSVPLLQAGEGQPVVVAFADGVAVHARRDFARERALEEEWIGRLGLATHRQSDGSFALGDLDEALGVVEAVQDHADQLQVEWASEAAPRLGSFRASDLELQVSRRRNWFQVSGGARSDLGSVDLDALLRAAREGRRWVEVAPGAFARIESRLRDRLAHADAHLLEDRGRHVFGTPAAEAVRDLAADTRFDAPVAFFDLVARAQRARTIEPRLEAPIARDLRPYQRDGFEWLARLGAWGVGGVLADDMGLGKTLQALALLTHRAEEGPALVVAPTSVVGNWAREAERFTPELRVRLHRGQARERRVGTPEPGEVLVTSYDIAVRDLDALREVRFGTVVLDEAQAVKNPSTRRARAMRDLTADLKIALTGTPIENHLGELWSIFRIVCPELLGSWQRFRGRFATPIEQEGHRVRRDQLADLLRPFILRRTKAEVTPELPSRTEVVLEVDLSVEERALYERERRRAIDATAGAKGDNRFALLAALTRLRQLSCDARLVEPTWSGPTTKLDELTQLVTELKEEGHRVLVFSQFRRLLALALSRLEAHGVVCLELAGETPAAERERRIDRFQAGGADAFLISLKAGGTGLNLTAATYVIHLDPWWNPAAEDQATDRAHRIGQTQPVTVYRLVSTDTVEQIVLSLHADKRALADGILAGTDAAATVDAEALAELLRHGWRS